MLKTRAKLVAAVDVVSVPCAEGLCNPEVSLSNADAVVPNGGVYDGGDVGCRSS